MDEKLRQIKRRINRKGLSRNFDTAMALYIKGIKRTRPRVLVYSMFQKSAEPISAKEIRLATHIDRATIYRILKIFLKVKLIENAGGMQRTYYQIS